MQSILFNTEVIIDFTRLIYKDLFIKLNEDKISDSIL